LKVKDFHILIKEMNGTIFKKNTEFSFLINFKKIERSTLIYVVKYISVSSLPCLQWADNSFPSGSFTLTWCYRLGNIQWSYIFTDIDLWKP